MSAQHGCISFIELAAFFYVCVLYDNTILFVFLLFCCLGLLLFYFPLCDVHFYLSLLLFCCLSLLLLYFPMLTASSFSSLMIVIHLRTHALHYLLAAYRSNLLIHSIGYHEHSRLPLQTLCSQAVVWFVSLAHPIILATYSWTPVLQ